MQKVMKLMSMSNKLSIASSLKSVRRSTSTEIPLKIIRNGETLLLETMQDLILKELVSTNGDSNLLVEEMNQYSIRKLENITQFHSTTQSHSIA
jgi:hypothetical protein